MPARPARPACAAPHASRLRLTHARHGQVSQEEFLETVKRRVSLKTPLDTSFWRPYVRGMAPTPEEGSEGAKNQTQLIFVAGAEGTGHHFITAVMMRLTQLMPMTLVQEQAFQALWWNPTARDPASFWSALEAFQQVPAG